MSEENQRADIWNLLHDGEITAIGGTVPGYVRITVNIAYLRRRFSPEGDSFVITLRNCTILQLKPYNEPVETDFQKIVSSKVEFLSTESSDCPIKLATTVGELEIDFQTFELSLDTGAIISYDQLDEASRNYWDAFASRSIKVRAEKNLPSA